MGYRSQVVLVIGKELQPHFMAALSVCNPATVCVFNDANRFDRDYYQDKSGHWLIVWDAIKWYDGFDEIKTLQKFVEEATSDCLELGENEGESGEHIKFVRVGEDSDDIEHRGYGFDDVYASTSIAF